MKDDVADAIRNVFVSPNESDSNGEAANLVDAVYSLGRSIQSAFKLLGNGDAATSLGAIEAHGAMVKEAGEKIASSLDGIAISLDGLADTIRELENA